LRERRDGKYDLTRSRLASAGRSLKHETPLPSARSSSPPPRAVAITVCAVVAAILAAIVIVLLSTGGGGHGTPTNVDPAKVVPASAALYVGADVRPKAAKQAAALAAGRSLTHQADPYTRLVSILQTPGSPTPDFARDVDPWLGARAGVFLSSLSSSGPVLSRIQQGLLGQSSAGGSFPFGAKGAQGAIVLDTTDLAKARAFLQSAAARAGAQATTYRGTSYQLSAGGVAFGTVRRLAVIGSDSGMHAVIDTAIGGGSLAGAPPYAALVAAAPPGAIAHLYSSAGGSGAAAPGLAGLLQLFSGSRQMNVSFVPTASSVALDIDTLGLASQAGQAGLPSFSSESAHALAELPGESWFAVGLTEVGRMLPADVQGLSSILSLAGPGASGAGSATGLGVGTLLTGLTLPLRALGASDPEARRSFQSWMTSGGLFATGTSLLELKAAVVINSKEPALSRAAVPKLAARLRAMGATVAPASVAGADVAIDARLKGLPVPLVIAEGRGAGGQSKFVIGVGEASVPAALNPPSTLAGAQSTSAAAAALGEGAQPSVILDVPTLLSLLEGIGLTEDPTISPFVPYLRSITTIAGGPHRIDPTVERFKIVAALRP
jgi:hypothetical protein